MVGGWYRSIKMRCRWFTGVGGLLIGLILAGCNFSAGKKEPSPRPTLGSPVAWATSQVVTATLSDTNLTAPVSTATSTPFTFPTFPSETASAPVAQPPTLTPAPTLTEPPVLPATQTPAPAAPDAAALPAPTHTPSEPVAFVPPPSFTPYENAPPTEVPIYVPPTAQPPVNVPPPQPTWTSAPGSNVAPPPTFTPVIFATPVPTSSAPGALVCASCSQLRLRDAPGTAGKITSFLDANTTLSIIGRTVDNVWVQVVVPDGRNGWVAAQYLTITIDLNLVSVTGTAQDAAVVGPGNIDVVSGISSNARKIFLDGRAKGNRAHTFTKVGDSITATSDFLYPIGYGSYRLGDYGYLGGAISFFSGPNGRGQNPFAAASIAARNGWSTESVLSPANADPGVCAPGESPLVCEYRVVKPAVALIMFGTNDSGGMPTETFRANLQAIVQTSINMGVIPVLSTIPPKRYNAATDARVDEFNQVIIATARAYDIPLWNYWLAMSRLPGGGLSGDGVHPSEPPDGMDGFFDGDHLEYGFPVRNLTALQVLYLLWQQVLYDGDQAPAATAPPSSGEPVPPDNSGSSGDTTACQALPPPQLTAGGQGKVTPGLPNKVRSQPGTAGAQIGAIPGDGVFQVIGGPTCADGIWWWQVNYNGLIGWTANGDSSEYWVQPYP